jgi:ribose-phosphate pyrophosphokinase
MTPIVLSLPGNTASAERLAADLRADRGHATVRRFPDGETYVRVETPIAGRDVILVCTLDHPDDKLAPLVMLAAVARELGAIRVGLVAPYLAYLRQDRRFQPGEGITSLHFARLLSGCIDWLVTVDPHLHRYHSLAEIYAIPSHVVHSAPLIADWIREHVVDPVVVGPDGESAQWVAAVAADVNAPYAVSEKIRYGDRDVEVAVPEIENWHGRTPVLVDDIISTARTLIKAVNHLRQHGMPPPVCVGVHGIFADRAFEDLRAAGSGTIVTCNTIPHASNGIDVSVLLADGVRQCLRPGGLSNVPGQ